MLQVSENAHRWVIAARIAILFDLNMMVARQWVESCPDEQRIIGLCEQVIREEHELTSRAFYHRLRITAHTLA